MNKIDTIPNISVTFVFKLDKKTNDLLSEFKKVDINEYKKQREIYLKIQSDGLKKIIEKNSNNQSLLEKFVTIIYYESGFELNEVTLGKSIEDGSISSSIVINVDEIFSKYDKSIDDFLNMDKLKQLGSIIGDGLNCEGVRIDIRKPPL